MGETINGPCSERVSSDAWGITDCSRKPTVVEDGKPWCYQHAPSAVEKRRAARDAKWAADAKRREAHWAEEAFAVRCAALVRAAGGTPEDVEAGRVRVTMEPAPEAQEGKASR